MCTTYGAEIIKYADISLAFKRVSIQQSAISLGQKTRELRSNEIPEIGSALLFIR